MGSVTTGPRADARVWIGLILAAFLGAAHPAEARPDPGRSAWTSGTFVYADLCTAAPSGTRIGRRITLRRSPNGDGLIYEAAETPGPVAAARMTLDDATKALAFAVETGAGPRHFEGIATPDALTGILEDEAGAHPIRLPRVLRSHAHEACPGETTGSIGGMR